jgi:hypothetical protein
MSEEARPGRAEPWGPRRVRSAGSMAVYFAPGDTNVGLGPSSVTIDARVTAMVYTGDQQSALLFADFLAQPIPPDAGDHDTHGRPLDPFSGGRSR